MASSVAAAWATTAGWKRKLGQVTPGPRSPCVRSPTAVSTFHTKLAWPCCGTQGWKWSAAMQPEKPCCSPSAVSSPASRGWNCSSIGAYPTVRSAMPRRYWQDRPVRDVRDDTGHPLGVGAVARVVSLVPSLTEAVAVTRPGLLVGATDWCTHPGDLAVTRVRGTKNPDVDTIVKLGPDLVLANEEENRAVDVQAL